MFVRSSDVASVDAVTTALDASFREERSTVFTLRRFDVADLDAGLLAEVKKACRASYHEKHRHRRRCHNVRRRRR